MLISRVFATEILDSRGNPTVEATIILENGAQGRASVPSGASTGAHEAHELRDGDETRYGGKGVLQAVEHVNDIIGPALTNNDAYDQVGVDNEVVLRDGTHNLEELGANATLAVSLAVSRAAAVAKKQPYYQYLNSIYQSISGWHTELKVPTPTFNVLNGGAHTGWESTDFQEFMVVPHKAKTFAEKLEQGSEIYHALKSILKEKNYSTLVGDEGGFAPKLSSNEEAVELLLAAITKAGLKPGLPKQGDVAIALDPATSELFDDSTRTYTLKTQNLTLTTDQLIDHWLKWLDQYPIISLEDGLAEDDWAGWQKLRQAVTDRGDKTILVGDDFLVTNTERISRAIKDNACNALLTKVNQIGTLSESLQAVAMAKQANWQVIISHRSGETEDTSIADLAVAVGADYAKMGAPARAERVGKYNQLLRIEQELSQNE